MTSLPKKGSGRISISVHFSRSLFSNFLTLRLIDFAVEPTLSTAKRLKNTFPL
jgi:hypothetical protein